MSDEIKKDNSLSIEEEFDRIKEIIEKMNDEDCPIEDAINLYTEGMKLCKDCNTRIEKIEGQIKVLDVEE